MQNNKNQNHTLTLRMLILRGLSSVFRINAYDSCSSASFRSSGRSGASGASGASCAFGPNPRSANQQPIQGTTRPHWDSTFTTQASSGTETIGCALQQCVPCIRSIGTRLFGATFSPFRPSRPVIGFPPVFSPCTDSRTVLL